MKRAFSIPPYLPDQTANSGAMVSMDNALPIADGYGPVRAFQSVSSAITGDFLGGVAVIANDGTSYLLVGTSSKLQRYASGAWTDLLTGLSVTDRWEFTGFGNWVVAVNGSTTYEIDLVAGTAAAIAGAPAGKSVAVVGDYVTIGQDSGDLISFFTSDVNNHQAWVPAAGATQQPQLVGGEIMGVAGGEYGVILQRRRLVRVSRTGDATLPFEYDAITDNVGCASAGSITQWGRSVFFLSDQGFMAFEDGQVPVPIGSEQVDRTFQALVPPDDYSRIFSAVDPVRKLVIWCVPGTPGYLFAYNYELKRWGRATMDMDGVFSAFTSSETLEGVSAANPDLDAMTLSLDDPSFAGGHPQLYVVQNGEIGTLSGAALAASFELGFVQFAEGKRAMVRSIRPVTDCTTGQTMNLRAYERHGDEATREDAGAYRASGRFPFRSTGRFHRLTWAIEAGSSWNYVQGFEAEFSGAGDR